MAQVFVTVGTTSFDALIEALDTPQVVDALRRKGYGSLTMQIGRGAYVPRRLIPTGTTALLAGGFHVEYFTFRPTLDACMRDASLVVSHAGAGSVFEALGAGKPLLVVVNNKLMDNHQAELAEELANRGHVMWCEPARVLEVLNAFDASTLVPYEQGECRVAEAFDELLWCCSAPPHAFKRESLEDYLKRRELYKDRDPNE